MAAQVGTDVLGYAWRFVCNTNTCCMLAASLSGLLTLKLLIWCLERTERRENNA